MTKARTTEVKLHETYEGGSESSVIGVITLLIDIIGCCIIPSLTGLHSPL